MSMPRLFRLYRPTRLAFLSTLLVGILLPGCATSPDDKASDETSPLDRPLLLQQAWRLSDGFAFRLRQDEAELYGRAYSSERPAMTIAPPAEGFEAIRPRSSAA